MTITRDRKSTRLNSSHTVISYAVFCLKKKKREGLLIVAGRDGKINDVVKGLGRAGFPEGATLGILPARTGNDLAATLCVPFFFNDTATTDIYTLSLHDALPIFSIASVTSKSLITPSFSGRSAVIEPGVFRSEEHTSELQSHSDLVCRLLLEKKKEKNLAADAKNKKKKENQNVK